MIFIFRNYKLKLDHYNDEELSRLKLLSDVEDVTINPIESTKVKLKINPRFDTNLKEGDDVDIEIEGQKNIVLICKSKVLPHRIIEVEIKTIKKSWTVKNGFVLGKIKAFGKLSGNDQSESEIKSDLEINDMQAEGQLITLDELCEICKDRSVTQLNGIFSHQAVNVSYQTCYKYRAYKSKHLATFLKCSKL